MSEAISHSGIVQTSGQGTVLVRIVQGSACHDCKIASHCSSAESKEKLVSVRTPSYADYQPGQQVNVLATNAVGRKAVVLAFVLPSILLLLGVGICVAMGLAESLAALVGLCVVALYYIMVWMLGDRLTHDIQFTLERA